MKKSAALILIALAIMILSGCAIEETNWKPEPISISKKTSKDKPLALEKVVAKNGGALAFAAEKKDFLENDRYLAYIIGAENRDKDEIAEKAAKASVEAVENVAAQIENQSPESSSAGNETSSETGSAQPTLSEESPATGSESISYTRYTDAAAGYSIELPSDWDRIEGATGTTQTVSAVSPLEDATDRFGENIVVGVEELPLEMSATEYLDLTVTGMQKIMTDFTELERSETTIGGKSAWKVIFSYKMGERELKDVMYAVANGFKGYQIVGTALPETFAEMSPIFESSAKSFKFE